MRSRAVALTFMRIASAAAGTAQQSADERRQIARDPTNPTRHTYDPAKLQVKEATLPDKESATGKVTVWRVVTDYGLILGTLSTKAEAEVALAAAKKFTAMVIVGSRPRTFTYFDR